MDRPMVLNEKIYDFKTILALNGSDPHNRFEFDAKDITPSRQSVAEFERIIETIKENRKALLEPSFDSSPLSSPRSR
jgi:hypothetical protein